jgi:predicted double-glycine peptidase
LTIPTPLKLWYNDETLINKKFILVVLFAFGVSFTSYAYFEKRNESNQTEPKLVKERKEVMLVTLSEYERFKPEEIVDEISTEVIYSPQDLVVTTNKIESPLTQTNVPFYSQFTDISAVKWQKVGCGIASLAMLIEYYEPGEVSVDKLLDEGIASKAFLEDAGWTHSGLANLVNKYGLKGKPFDYSSNSMESAYAKLNTSLEEGPVMASVFYTFDPKSPIPHLVVINSIDGDIVYYNDPSDKSGNRSISSTKFKKAWKKRFIEVRPA